VLAALGANDIFGARFATCLFRESNLNIRDDQYLNERTAVLAARIETHPCRAISTTLIAPSKL